MSLPSDSQHSSAINSAISSRSLGEQKNFLLPRATPIAPIGYKIGNENKGLFYAFVALIIAYWAWICNTHWILSLFRVTIPVLFFVALTGNLHAQQNTSKQEKFWVAGVCDGCKKEIETAAKGVKGVTKAEWDLKTKFVTIGYNAAQTSSDALKKALVASGRKVKSPK